MPRDYEGFQYVSQHIHYFWLGSMCHFLNILSRQSFPRLKHVQSIYTVKFAIYLEKTCPKPRVSFSSQLLHFLFSSLRTTDALVSTVSPVQLQAPQNIACVILIMIAAFTKSSPETVLRYISCLLTFRNYLVSILNIQIFSLTHNFYIVLSNNIICFSRA